MRVLFASDYAHIPENTGGLEINTHELCLALRNGGHQPAVLASLVGRGVTGFVAKAKCGRGWRPGGQRIRAWDIRCCGPIRRPRTLARSWIGSTRTS